MDDRGDRLYTLTQTELDQVIEAAIKRTRGDLWVEDPRHFLHHRWVDEQLDDERVKTQTKRRLIEKWVGAISTISLVGFLGWVGHQALQTLAELISKLPINGP